jgi:hypothetical protein
MSGECPDCGMTLSGVPPQKVIRVIDAADNETIDIRWWRVRVDDSSDPPQRITEILTTSHIVPPLPVWTARLKDDPNA